MKQESTGNENSDMEERIQEGSDELSDYYDQLEIFEALEYLETARK